jgi:hypothetical protein
VTDEPKAAAPVSMSKAPADAGPVASTRPRTVVVAVALMGLSGVAALVAAVSLHWQHDWLAREQRKADVKASKYHTTSEMNHLVSQQQSGALIMSTVLTLAIFVLAFSVYRGRYWSRWGVVAFWFLASFSGTFAGFTYAFAIGSSVPNAFKLPVFLCSVSLIAAVVLVNLRPSTEFFALSKPKPVAGAPARRGLFAPRTPVDRSRPRTARTAAAPTKAAALKSSAASRGETYVRKQRSKTRATANAESIARGAQLARSRAKASKSRRIDT